MAIHSGDSVTKTQERVAADVVLGLAEAAEKDTGEGAWVIVSVANEVLDLRVENDRLLRALAYLAECHAATAESEGNLKRTSQRSRKRFASICSKAAEMLEGADLPETRWGREGGPHVARDRCRRAAKDLS